MTHEQQESATPSGATRSRARTAERQTGADDYRPARRQARRDQGDSSRQLERMAATVAAERTGRSVTRALVRRLERIEEQVMSVVEPKIWQIVIFDSDGK